MMGLGPLQEEEETSALLYACVLSLSPSPSLLPSLSLSLLVFLLAM